MKNKVETLVCPICNEPTRVYMGNARKDRLCAKHADKLKNNEIVQCEECENWHSTEEPCSCKIITFTELPTEGFENCIICNANTGGYAFCKNCWKKYSNEEMLEMLNNKQILSKEMNKEIVDSEKVTINIKDESITTQLEKKENLVILIDEQNKSKCITCGRKTDGLLFCTSCYHKYKNKELLFKITNCSTVELLDENYEGRYTCKDGHIVKSKSERDIDNYLFEHSIPHAYEKELPYGASESETLHPDFYLPHYLGQNKHVYIEHWGYNENNIQYTKTKNFKMPIYKKLCDDKELTMICTYEKTDMGKIDTVLDRKLNKSYIQENKINFEE